MTGSARVFGVPALLAAVSGFGLLSALIGDGPWDALSWAALAVPLAVIAWKWSRPVRSSGPARRPG